MASTSVLYDDKRIPEQLAKTLNTADGSYKVVEDIPVAYEVSYLEISNNSTTGQIIYVGYGQPAVSGINPIGPGFARIDSIDAKAHPFSGDVYVLTGSDGAVISVQRRIQVRSI